jgi:hypothetical protein
MKTRRVLTVLGAVTMCAAASARADPLDLKLGLWETTMTSSVSGTLMPDAQMERLSPAQREAIQAMMKKREADGPKAHTFRTCLTREDLAKPFEKEDEDEAKHCKRTTLVATRARQEIDIACEGDGPEKREWRMEAKSRERVTGDMKVVSAKGSVTMHLTAKWIASECPKGD